MHIFKCPYCQEELEAKEYLVPSWENFEAEIECPICSNDFTVDIDLSKVRISTFILG